MTASALRRPFRLAAADLVPAVVPLGALLGLAALHGAGLRVLAAVGLPLLGIGAFGRGLPGGPRGARLSCIRVRLVGGALIARSPLAFGGGAILLAVGVATAWGVNRARRR